MALSRVVSEIINVEKCRDLEIRVKCHSRSLKVAPLNRLCMVSYWCSLVTLSLKRTGFGLFDLEVYSVLEIRVLGHSRSSKNDTTIRSGTHDFLLTFHNSYWPISHRFRDKRRFPSKIANFPTPCIHTPRRRGYPRNWVSSQRSEETRMMRLPGGRKKF